jgi:hypothetical protein
LPRNHMIFPLAASARLYIASIALLKTAIKSSFLNQQLHNIQTGQLKEHIAHVELNNPINV